MILLPGFVLPVALFALLWLFFERRGPWDAVRGDQRPAGVLLRWAPIILLFAVSTVSVATVGRIIRGAGGWPQHTEIVWRAIRMAEPSAPLVVGGADESALIGWPTGAHWPELRVEGLGNQTARLTVRGGGAIVRVGKEAVNGVRVAPGNDAVVGSTRVGLACVPRRLRPCADKVLLTRGSTEIDLDPPTKQRAASVWPKVQEGTARLRTSGAADPAAEALAFEDWASGAVIAADDDEGESVRVVWVDPSSGALLSAEKDIALPAELTVSFPGRTIRLRIRTDTDGAPVVVFDAPWQRVAPLPEEAITAARVLTITGQPRPGDTAFEMPFGHAMEDPRTDVRLGLSGGDTVFLDGTACSKAPPVMPGTQPKADDGMVPHGCTSKIVVVLGSLRAEIMTVRDVLDPAARSSLWLAWLFGAVFSVWSARWLTVSDRWPLALTGAALWQLLTLRFLLAARYAFDPAGVDQISVGGLASAAVAVAIVPALFWFGVRLYRQTYLLPRFRRGAPSAARRAADLNFVGLAVIAAAAVLQWRRTVALAPNLPVRPGTTAVLLAFGVPWLVMLVHAVAIRGSLRRADEVSPFALLVIPQKLVAGLGAGLWDSLMRRSHRTKAYFVAWSAAGALALLMLFVMNGLSGRTKVVQDVAAPLLMVWVPVLLWAAWFRGGDWSRRQDRRHSWSAVGLLGLPLVALPIFSPVAVLDPGGIFATLAVLLPLALAAFVVVTARDGIRGLARSRVGVMMLVYTVGSVALGITLFETLPRLPALVAAVVERGYSRYLVFKLGDEVQTALPYAQARAHVGNGIPVQSLQNAIVHTWENRAMARAARNGGWGFGGAPTRQSAVPQAVLTYDSTFSFFILSEFGPAGGVAVLLLYTVPFLAVMASARRRFDAGHLLAGLVGVAFLNEALVHAAMNLGSLPFTGRNLPLLSVNSSTDLLRWLTLFTFMAQCTVWNSTAADSALAPPVGESLVGGVGARESWLKVAWPVGALVLVPALAAAFLVAVPLIDTLGKRGAWLDLPFTWNEYHHAIRRMIDDGDLAWNPASRRIETKLPIQQEGDTVIEQEVAKFDSLPDEEKFEESPRLELDLDPVRTLAQYDAFVAALRTQSATRPPRRHLTLFTVVRDRTTDPVTGDEEVTERLAVNPDVDLSKVFRATRTRDELPVVRFRARPGEAADSGTMLMGPAWVNGRWRIVRDRSAAIPWMDQAGSLIANRWTADRAAAAGRYGTLTLDEGLQYVAAEFVAKKGRERHAQLLAAGAPGIDRRTAKLPPRIALSIVEVPSGKVVALGGWPRTASSGDWETLNGELLPPAGWLANGPRALQRRYQSDRNFDRLEMGSASKPLWATAVLLVHPTLPRVFATTGGGGSEDEVFGIPVGRPWHVMPSGWTGFTRYLSQSDNRYHIRLGFLGLAEPAGTGIKTGGPSLSTSESMDGGKTYWGRTPAFPDAVGFSAAHPRTLINVAETPLAANLRDVFGAGISAGEVRDYRLSFWTGDERDNLPGPANALAALSPEATELRLDAVKAPRQFVSQLLGGDENRWANVEFAAAFGTAVTGHAVVSHILDGVTPAPAPNRRDVPDTAAQVRAGLQGAVLSGTATSALRDSGALKALAAIPGVRLYAKTGTLSLGKNLPETSRLVLAIVRWDDERAGRVKSGLVLSLVVERGRMGMAARWLGEFIAGHGQDIRQLLQSR